jgi:SAM-dependent methyltransferase
VVAAAGVADGRAVLDVGCGFGGTLAHIAARHRRCRLAGLNIDERQLRWSRRLLAPVPPLVVGDGAPAGGAVFAGPRAGGRVCVPLPPAREFFRESGPGAAPRRDAGAVRLPAGRRGLSTFLAKVAELGPGDWYGHSAAPVTSAAYERLGRVVGFEMLDDEDVTTRTLPTCARRACTGGGGGRGVATLDRVERLATHGAWEYHVLAFRRRP